MTTRLEVAAEARRWLATPFAHQGRTRGLGCDCGGLVGGVAVALGIVPPTWWREVFDLPVYRSALPVPNVMGLVESEAFAPFRRLGQRALCHDLPRKLAAPSMSGMFGRLRKPTDVITALARKIFSPSGPRAQTFQIACFSSQTSDSTSMPCRMSPRRP